MTAPPNCELTLKSLLTGFQSGALTPESVIASVYDRIEAAPLNPVWITLIPRETALANARALDPQKHLPLYGIPFAVKDNIDVAGYPTTAACPAYSYIPERTAFVVERLQSAGAILIGKTNMDQFATGLVGTRSPFGSCSSVFNELLISGGSSSGSAVAVAAGLVSFALGTDTAGSGRVPAAFNNIVGLKPSRGLLSMAGVVPACRSLDCLSVFALSCADASAVFEVANASDPADPFSRSRPALPGVTLDSPRIGIPQRDQLQFFGNTEYAKLYAETIQSLETTGQSVLAIDIKPFLQAAELLYAGPYVAERFAAVGSFIKRRRSEVDPTVASIIETSEKWSAADAFNAQYELKKLAREVAPLWDQIDVLLLPTAPTTYTIDQVRSEPFDLNANLGYYTNFVNLLDLCGVAVPAGLTARGLPFGATAIGPAFADQAVLEFADRIHHARNTFSGNNVTKLSASTKMPPVQPKGWVSLGVVGAHLSGQPLNHQLTERRAKYVTTTRTARDYRFYALSKATPAKPGLIREPGFEGPGIEIEVWSMQETQFGSFVAAIPAPLSIGSCELASGEVVKGFLCEPYAVIGMPEITALGSWRAYVDSLKP